MRFDDVVMDYDEQLGGVRGVVEYGEYELSIVQHAYSYGVDKGLFEIGVFNDNAMVELPGITQDGDTVKGYLTPEAVNAIMMKMTLITGSEGIQQ